MNSHRRQQALCALICACLVVNVCSKAVDDDDDSGMGIYMWDLNVDPTESNNIYGNPDYAEQQAYLENMVTEWQGLAGKCDSTFTADGSGSVYAECGGICPNLTSNFFKLDVQQKYSTTNPPNIVFLLADDWGFNDVGFRSTYMSWTTPNIDSFVAGGIKLDNYFTHYYCAPSRAALMTGRQAARLGMIDENEGCELPLSETLLGQEMQSAGYRTYAVGKWHLGSSSYAATPLYRGFDEFYGFYSGYIDYDNKYQEDGYLDLQNGMQLETDPALLDSNYHSVFLFQSKAEEFIAKHATEYANTPMFMYYAIQLVHFPFKVPNSYAERCANGMTEAGMYCGMNLMLDEVVANVTCALNDAGLMDNTVIVMASDNGGNRLVPGNSYPFRGYKYDQFRGGISANAFIWSPLLDESLRGTSYEGQMHVTDWMPTLMHIATDGAWTGSYTNAVLDGVDMWDAIMSNLTSPRSEIVHYASLYTTAGSVQKDMIKYDYLQDLPDVGVPSTFFTEDLHPTYAAFLCDVGDLSINGDEEDLKKLQSMYKDDHKNSLNKPGENDNTLAFKKQTTSARGSTGLFESVGTGSAKVQQSIKEKEATQSLFDKMKSSSDYVMWLVGAGFLISLMMFLSRRNNKQRNEKYLPIGSDQEVYIADSALESGKLSAYHKSLN